jgi:hypothetical protein
VLVSTTDGYTIDGLLETEARDGVVLRAAFLLGDGDPVPIEGEVFVPRERVSMVQFPASRGVAV